MRHYEIARIDGLPPRKDGANSMWGKGEEFPRLLTLRTSVLREFAGAQPLKSNIEIRVHVHAGNLRCGDLDNFITGICDGLMKAVNSATIFDSWSMRECVDVHPNMSIGIVDDSSVVSIVARKSVDSDECWYSLGLSGE